MKRKLLVANRGEIALRVIRAARELGIPSAALAAGRDRELPYAEAAGELHALPEDGPREPFLDARLLVDLARRAGADLVHPGYGFLSENADFAEACAAAGLTFVGPPPGALRLTGDKTAARERAARAGVPVLPGAVLEDGSPREAAREAARIGYPVLIKAAAGGGGRGIRKARDEAALLDQLESASREARAAFGDGRIYLEKELEDPRHVEVQVLADGQGRIALFPERECSIQRRHQKVIEESPSPAVDEGLRAALGEAARSVADAVGYRNAGTVEFLLDADGRFYFLEVNARLQVEHPVTEEVARVDLVAWQLRIALGERLPEELAGPRAPSGHAIECRICAEEAPAFTPSSGRLVVFRPPSGPGIRFDAGYREGNLVEPRYDSLLAKLIAWGPDRPSALARMESALASTVVLGIDSTSDFLADVLRHPDFRAGRTSVRFIPARMAGWKRPEAPREALWIAHEIESGAGLARGGGGRGAGGGAGPGPWESVRSLAIS